MDSPQTKKQQINKGKDSMEFKRKGKGSRAIIKSQELSLNKNKKK